MVRGLNVFRERFAGFQDRYVLIGGAAVEVAMDAAALQFRVTKDLDIVLHVESLDAEFRSRGRSGRLSRMEVTSFGRRAPAN